MNANLDDIEHDPPLTTRIRRVLAIPVRLVAALVVPDRSLADNVRAGRTAAALLVATAAALAAALIIGQRLDMTSTIYAKYPDRPGVKAVPTASSGKTEDPKSDHDIDEEIKKERSMEQVKMGLGAGLGTPFFIVLLGVGLFVVGKFVGGKPTLIRTIAASAHAALPGAVKSGIIAVSAYGHDRLTPEMLPSLVPPLYAASGPGLAARLMVVDPFRLWAVVLLGFGLSAAANLRLGKSFVTVVVLYVLYSLLSGAA